MTAKIPRFEPEVVAAGAKKRGGDDEKVPTTSIDCLEVHGVVLTSRYGKAHEFEIMSKMVEAVDEELRPFIESMYCDSKATSCYDVTLAPVSKTKAALIATQLEEACIANSCGHNGISFNGAPGANIDRDPFWDEPDPSSYPDL